MDQNAFDLDLGRDLDQDLAPDLDFERDPVDDLEPASTSAMDRATRGTPRLRPIPTLTNSPGCAPAPPSQTIPTRATGASGAHARRSGSAAPSPMRSVRIDAWSSPATACWARPSRTLRKVARRALDLETVELA